MYGNFQKRDFGNLSKCYEYVCLSVYSNHCSTFTELQLYKYGTITTNTITTAITTVATTYVVIVFAFPDLYSTFSSVAPRSNHGNL